jgi:2-dehydro-3-deoxygluconokinase
MAGLSPSATEVVAEAMQTARRHGVAVSFDCNYRPSLWQSRGGREGAVQVNRSLMPYVDVLFGHEGDVSATTGELLHRLPWHTGESFGPMAERVLAEFPNLRAIASTVRKATSANRNHWGAFCWASGNVYTGLQFADLEILDRVGGGDSFAAGVIHGLLAGKGAQWAVDCGVAHGALAMTTPGDSSMATLAEVERLMQGGSAAVQR